jgi:hypothetical protein
MEHRAEALFKIEGIEDDLRHGLTQREIETKRLVCELAKIHALLAIEERLGYIQHGLAEGRRRV